MTSLNRGEMSFLSKTFLQTKYLTQDVLGTIYDIARLKEYDLDDFDRVAREIRGDFTEIKWRVEEQMKEYEFGR